MFALRADNASVVSMARDRVAAWLAGHRWPAEESHDIVYAVSEAVTNVCEHAYENTRRDLQRRAGELGPILARHGLRLREDLLARPRAMRVPGAARRPAGLRATATELRDPLGHLRDWMARAE